MTSRQFVCPAEHLTWVRYISKQAHLIKDSSAIRELSPYCEKNNIISIFHLTLYSFLRMILCTDYSSVPNNFQARGGGVQTGAPN